MQRVFGLGPNMVWSNKQPPDPISRSRVIVLLRAILLHPTKSVRLIETQVTLLAWLVLVSLSWLSGLLTRSSHEITWSSFVFCSTGDPRSEELRLQFHLPDPARLSEWNVIPKGQHQQVFNGGFPIQEGA